MIAGWLEEWRVSQGTPKHPVFLLGTGRGPKPLPSRPLESAPPEGLLHCTLKRRGSLADLQKPNPTRSRTPHEDYFGIPTSKVAGGLLVRSADGARSDTATYMYVYHSPETL